MPGPFLPVWAISRSQNIRIGNHNSASGNHTVPMLTKNPSTAALPTPYLVDLSDGTSRRDLAHHLAIGSLVTAHGLRLTSSLAANSAAIAASLTEVNTLAIPANALNPGASIRVTAQASVSAAATVTFDVKCGTAGTTADANVATLSIAPAAAGFLSVDALITCQVAGSGTNGKLTWGINGVIGTLSASNGSTSQVSVDTTIPEIIGVAASTSAGTITFTNCLIEFLDSAF